MVKKVYANSEIYKWRTTIKSLLIGMILLLVFTSVSFAVGGGRYAVNSWSFGVHGDTQWTVTDPVTYLPLDPTGNNPNTVSAAVAQAIGDELRDKGVKFVIQVGDLSDQAGDAAMYSRADAAQPLFDAGVGFFPLRGNHETFGKLFGTDPELDMDIPAFLDAFPQTRGLANTFGATNFSSPSDIVTGVEGIDLLDGLSYAFDYNDATFVIVDVEQTYYWEKPAEPHPVYGQGYDYPSIFPTWVLYKYTEDIQDSAGNTIPAGSWFRIDSSGYPSTNFYGWEAYWPLDSFTVPQAPKMVSEGTEFWPGDQQAWISERLDAGTRDTEHAFVFSHRPLMGANHADGFFGSNPGSKSSQQNPFYASLMNNGVKYMISGHDHIYNRALLDSPDGFSQVEQLIAIGASTKFYDPASIDSFTSYYGPVKQRETQISQETWNIGYYVYTVDGPRVTVDYYSDSVGNFADGNDYPDGDGSGNGSLDLPDFDFVKKETWGYSHNGQQFLIAQGDSYVGIEDSFSGTTAKILAGTNNSTTTDETPYDYDENDEPYNGPRALNKTVNTGWVANPDPVKLKSDILSLWGMSELGADGLTDTYVLSMSIDFRRMVHLGNGGIGIATYVDGEWVNAVDENTGGTKNFVLGKYKPKYGLGTYGVDPSTKTAWAVLNYNADFAVAMDIEPVPGKRK